MGTAVSPRGPRQLGTSCGERATSGCAGGAYGALWERASELASESVRQNLRRSLHWELVLGECVGACDQSHATEWYA